VKARGRASRCVRKKVQGRVREKVKGRGWACWQGRAGKGQNEGQSCTCVGEQRLEAAE